MFTIGIDYGTNSVRALVVRCKDGAELGTGDTEFFLRATHGSRGPGRVYSVTYRATDKAGNISDVSAKVTVPQKPTAPPKTTAPAKAKAPVKAPAPRHRSRR